MAGPAAVRWRRGPGCGALLLLPALLVSWAACQAPPVPAAEPPWDGADISVERRFVPESCPRAVRPGDFVRYHYLGAFPDGARFDSRSGLRPPRGLACSPRGLLVAAASGLGSWEGALWGEERGEPCTPPRGRFCGCSGMMVQGGGRG